MRYRFFNTIFDVSNIFHVSYAIACSHYGIGDPSKIHPDLIPEHLCPPSRVEDINKMTLYGFFKRVYQINNEFRDPKGTSYFLFDSKDEELNKTHSTRKLIQEDYKRGRKQRSENFYSLLKTVGSLLSNLDDSFVIIARPSFEADDLVQPLLEKETISNKVVPSLLVSNDLDWARSVDNDSVHIYQDHKLHDLSSISLKLGLSPDSNRITLYKMVFGDSSDGISKPEPLKNIRGGDDELLMLINTLSNPRDLLTLTSDKLKNCSEKLRSRLLSKETQNALVENLKLIDFLDFNSAIEKYMTYCTFNKKVLLNLIKPLDLLPDKIYPNLSALLDWDNVDRFSFGY